MEYKQKPRTKFYHKLKDHNITLYRVSKDTGISRMALYNWCAGINKPTLGMFAILCEYLRETHNMDINPEDFTL